MKRIKNIRILVTTKGWQHDLSARIVYSVLAFFTRWDDGRSARGIGEALSGRMDDKTIRKALTTLGPLVEKRGRKWYAVEPPFGLFATANRDAASWFDRIASYRLYLPRRGARIGSSRFNLSHSTLYSLLLSLSQDGVATNLCDAYLRQLLNKKSHRTIDKSLADLERAGLLRVEPIGGRRYQVVLLELTEQHRSMFVAKPAKKEPQKSGKATENGKPQGTANNKTPKKETQPKRYQQSGKPTERVLSPEQEYRLSVLLKDGVPETTGRKIVILSHFMDDIDYEQHRYVSRMEHEKSRAKGKYGYKHYGYLLLYKIEAKQKDRDERWDKEEKRMQWERAFMRQYLPLPAEPVMDTVDHYEVAKRLKCDVKEADRLTRILRRSVSLFVDERRPKIGCTVQMEMDYGGEMYDHLVLATLESVSNAEDFEAAAKQELERFKNLPCALPAKAI